MVVELVFNNASAELSKKYADHYIGLASADILWYKESLYHIGLNYLPTDCEYVTGFDDSIKALKTFTTIQPFSHCIWLPPFKDTLDAINPQYPQPGKEGGKHHSFGFGWQHFGEQGLKAHVIHGHPDIAWIAPRKLMEVVKFFDCSIIGGGDSFIAHGFVGAKESLRRRQSLYTKGLLNEYAIGLKNHNH